MGFRNPLTSLSGDQITPGTITGSTFQTAASGRRVRLDAAGNGTLAFYSGDPQERRPGTVVIGVDPGTPQQGAAGDAGFLGLTAPTLAYDEQPAPESVVVLRGATRDGVDEPSVQLRARTFVTGDLDVSGDLTSAPVAWVPLIGMNGWQSYHLIDATYPPAAVARFDNLVVYRGLMYGGAVTNGTVMAAIAPEFRPQLARSAVFPAVSANAFGSLGVTGDGFLRFRTGAATWISLGAVAYLI